MKHGSEKIIIEGGEPANPSFLMLKPSRLLYIMPDNFAVAGQTVCLDWFISAFNNKITPMLQKSNAHNVAGT
jgi:hypothetical protein